MRRFIILISLSPALFFGSCNNPLNKDYDPATYEDDIQAIHQSNKVSDDDVELLAKYIVVSKLAGNDLQGKSYDEILDRIKSIRKNNEDLLVQHKNEQLIKRERLEPFLKVTLTDKKFSRVGDKDCMIYTVMFENRSPQAMKTVIGSIQLNDILEKEIKKIDIVYDQVLPSKTTVKKTYAFDYGYSDLNDQRLRSKDIVDMRIEWNPEKIIFQNGKFVE